MNVQSTTCNLQPTSNCLHKRFGSTIVSKDMLRKHQSGIIGIVLVMVVVLAFIIFVIQRIVNANTI